MEFRGSSQDPCGMPQRPGGGCSAVNAAIRQAFAFDQVQQALSLHANGKQEFLSVSGIDVGVKAAALISEYIANEDRPGISYVGLNSIRIAVSSMARIAKSLKSLGEDVTSISMRTLATVNDAFFQALAESVASTTNLENVWVDAFMLANASGGSSYPGFVSFLEKVLNEGVPHLKTVAINFGRMGSAVSGWKEELPPADSAAVFEAPEAITLLLEFMRSAPASHSLQSLTFNHSRICEADISKLSDAAASAARWKFGRRGTDGSCIYLKRKDESGNTSSDDEVSTLN